MNHEDMCWWYFHPFYGIATVKSQSNYKRFTGTRLPCCIFLNGFKNISGKGCFSRVHNFFLKFYLQHNNTHEEQSQLITIQHTIQEPLTKRKYVYICIKITTIKTGGGGGVLTNRRAVFKFPLPFNFPL